MVELKNVNVHYSSGVDALQNINLRINDGEFVFIVGGSGAGKSTLVKLMTREIVPTEGRVFVNGYNLSKTKGNKIAKFRRSIGMVFQDFRLIQELNVYENVAFVLRIADQSTRFIKQRVPNVLNLVGLGNKARSKPRELPAASSSAWQSQGRSQTTRGSSSRTSLPETSTRSFPTR